MSTLQTWPGSVSVLMAPSLAQNFALKQSTSAKARCWLKSSEGAAQLQCVSSSSSINLSLRTRGDVIFSQDLHDSLYAVRILGQARAGSTMDGHGSGLLLLVPATRSQPTFCFRFLDPAGLDDFAALFESSHMVGTSGNHVGMQVSMQPKWVYKIRAE